MGLQGVEAEMPPRNLELPGQIDSKWTDGFQGLGEETSRTGFSG